MHLWRAHYTSRMPGQQHLAVQMSRLAISGLTSIILRATDNTRWMLWIRAILAGMKRVLVLAVIVLGGAYSYEAYTGHEIGVRRSFDIARGAVSGGMAGGFGVATGAAKSVGGSAAGLASGISGNMGSVFSK